MEQRKVAAVAEVELTRGAKGEYRWVVKTAATAPLVAIKDVLVMDMRLTEEYYPDELEYRSEILAKLAVKEIDKEKEERDGD